MSPIGSVDINPSVASILVGEDVTFECSSDGGPDNQYQWTNLQSGDIISNIPYLVIESVSVSDGGQYECNVSNEAGYETAVSTINSMLYYRYYYYIIIIIIIIIIRNNCSLFLLPLS